MTRASDTAKLLGAGATILDGTTISTADNTDTLTLKSTDADANTGPTLFMQRDSASPADGDSIGKISFVADNDAGEATRFARIDNQISDASNGTEDALMFITTMIGGTELSRMTLQPTEAVFNEESADIDFRVESDNLANALFVQGSDGFVGLSSSAPARKLTVNGVGSAADILLQTTNSGATASDGFLLEADTNGDAYVWSYENANMYFATNNAEMMRISTANAGVFIGTTSTSGTVEGLSIRTGVKNMCVVAGGTVFEFNRNTNDGTIISLRQANTVEGTISVSGSTVSYNAFSGSHWSRLADNSKPTILKGTVIETIDEMCDWYQAEFTIAATTKKDEEGNDVEDTPEITEKVSVALPDGKSVGDTMSVTHEGITYDNAKILKEDDNKHTKCKISATADSKRVYGVFADFDNDDDTVNDMYVTAVGTHVVRINKDVTVSAGDLLSSNGDGTAKVQDDDIIRSKTIGKVLTNIKQETYSDGSYTVPCALYCG
jgi:hypothetical protein